MEKKMENEMESEITLEVICVVFYLGILWYPIALRLFSKTLLSLNSESQHNVNCLSVGGIAGRQGMQAWLLASLHAEDTWRHDRSKIKNLQGIAIDTEKN